MKTLYAFTAMLLLGTTYAAAQDDSITPPKHERKEFCPKLNSAVVNALHPEKETHAVLCFHVEPDGWVKDVMVLRSSGTGILDHRWAECIATWKYVPAMQEGKPVRYTVTFDVAMCGRESDCNKAAPIDVHEECEKALASPPAK